MLSVPSTDALSEIMCSYRMVGKCNFITLATSFIQISIEDSSLKQGVIIDSWTLLLMRL